MDSTLLFVNRIKKRKNKTLYSLHLLYSVYPRKSYYFFLPVHFTLEPTPPHINKQSTQKDFDRTFREAAKKKSLRIIKKNRSA